MRISALFNPASRSGALSHSCDPVFIRNAPDFGENATLAEVAAVRAVVPIALFHEGIDLAYEVPNAMFSTEIICRFQFAFGHGGVRAGDRDNAISQHLVGDRQQQRGVHAARETHREGTVPSYHVLQSLQFDNLFI